MPRKPLFRTAEFPYHLCARSNNKDWFSVPMETCWSIFSTFIMKTQDRYGFETHAFVLMSNHFHWVVSTPEMNVDLGMRYFLTETSRSIGRASGRINHVYGTRYKWSVINDAAYFAHAYRYVLRNPVRAGVVQRVQDYPWSGLHARLWRDELPRQLAGFVPEELESRLAWLNVATERTVEELVRKGLRRPTFSFPIHPTTKRAFDPLEEL